MSFLVRTKEIDRYFIREISAFKFAYKKSDCEHTEVFNNKRKIWDSNFNGISFVC